MEQPESTKIPGLMDHPLVKKLLAESETRDALRRMQQEFRTPPLITPMDSTAKPAANPKK
ncbi:hypothetical protein [Chitinimonas sp.]|uniref:hypothetical protein n=1 Tax=Chitinimonas sp. TaxID=1934313 RepID=UPI0035AE2F80